MRIGRFAEVTREEVSGIELRAILGRLAASVLPNGAAGRLRSRLLRTTGLAVGDRTLLTSSLTVIGGRGSWGRLTIGTDCYVNQDCVFDATESITIGDHVALGHGVLITTSSHLIGHGGRRAGLLKPEPVRIGHGAWLASRVVVLPGVEIGDGAVVCAGAVVTRSVAPHTMVGGVPARFIRTLDPD